MKDIALLLLRLTLGGLLVGHGAQKLFGAFGGHGIEGTGGFMEKLGLKPGERWATLAGLSEFGGGLFTLLGLGGPIGPMSTIAPMFMATSTAHAGKPIWGQEGGPELPVTNMAISAALGLSGHGKYSLDHVLGIRIPGWLNFLSFLGIGAGVAYALMSRELGGTQAQAPQASAPTAIDDPQRQRIQEIGEHQSAA